MERLRFNTALATLMDQLNYLVKLAPADAGRFAFESYAVMLAPMAPHIAEELWRALGHTTSVHLEAWPKFSEELTRDEMVTVVVQVNGKVRHRQVVPAGTSKEANVALAREAEPVQRYLGGKPEKGDPIFVPDKLINFIT
jgi:leucyl-tRNA synthetase